MERARGDASVTAAWGVGFQLLRVVLLVFNTLLVFLVLIVIHFVRISAGWGVVHAKVGQILLKCDVFNR